MKCIFCQHNNLTEQVIPAQYDKDEFPVIHYTCHNCGENFNINHNK